MGSGCSLRIHAFIYAGGSQRQTKASVETTSGVKGQRGETAGRARAGVGLHDYQPLGSLPSRPVANARTRRVVILRGTGVRQREIIYMRQSKRHRKHIKKHLQIYRYAMDQGRR
jgi:hypothetical protein